MNKALTNKYFLLSTALILTCLMFAPIMPISNPDDLMTSAQFEQRKPEIDAIAAILNQEFETKLSETKSAKERKEVRDTYRYQLGATSGDYSGWKPLVAGPHFRQTSTSGYAFDCFVKEGVPYLTYDQEDEHTYIDPTQFHALKAYVERIKAEHQSSLTETTSSNRQSSDS